MKMIKSRVLVEIDPLETTTKSGIILVDPKQERGVFGTIRSIGPDVEDVTVGERVTFCKHQGSDLTIGGKNHTILNEDLLLGGEYA